MHTPDPVLTASIHTSTGLDGVIHAAIVPFWRELRDRGGAERWRLWMVRYGRRGPHLKLRLHGPGEERGEVRASLERAVRAHLPAPPGTPAAGKADADDPDAPPIDTEDEGAGGYPEGALLWTHYRRSPVSLGPAAHLGSDRYAALLTACLACAGEMALAEFEAGIPPAGARQRALLRGVIAGLGATRFRHASREEYLAYHRDWLLRFCVADEPRAAEARAQMDRHVDAMGDAVERIGRVAEEQWRPDASAEAGDDRDEDGDGSWRGAIDGLCRYLEAFDGADGAYTDPFAGEPMMGPVFKVFHGLANQLGVPVLQEALVHHLVLRAAGGAAVSLAA
ncbi:MAG TPA: lantibiotic dehydratase C-terminal domain-containing protein [Longimicrobium sp.]|nr:lantibiotic dehydratase C-terminal domain-containing protein [Longimicrobium sp.]